MSSIIHGKITHLCNDHCKWYLSPPPTPDVSVSVERVGGGAAAEGFVAFLRRDEPYGRTLTEDWEEENCFYRAVSVLTHEEGLLLSWPTVPERFVTYRRGYKKLLGIELAAAIQRVDTHLIP